MEPARAFLAVLGLVFAVGGVAVASVFDPLAGIACLVTAGFLLVLPLLSSHADE